MEKNLGKRIAFCLVSILGFTYACSDKDFYDPSHGGGVTDNPLELAVPAGFNWSLMATKQLRVEVDDEFEGKYYYVVEVFADNPLFSENASLLAKGVAKKDEPFLTSVDIPAARTNVFIRRIDPKGRAVVGSVELSQGDESVVYDFSDSIFQSRASTRAATISLPDYSEVPAGALEITGDGLDDLLKPGKDYVISGDYNGGIYYYGSGPSRLFITGTWNVGLADANWHSQIEKGLEIIVLPGGKIIDEAQKLNFVGSRFIIMEKGSFHGQGLYFTTGASCVNLGEIIVKGGDITYDSNAEFYNGGNIVCSGTIDYTNSCQFTNTGKIQTANMDLTANAILDNSCAVIVENNFTCQSSGALLDLNAGYVKAASFVFNNARINLSEGSMIQADKIENRSSVIYTASGQYPSLVKANTVACTSVGNRYIGNMVVEAVSHTASDPWTDYFKLQKGAKMAKPGDAPVIIETCDGGGSNPNPGTDPKDPDFPLEVETSTVYIYAMEDLWPTYGDYDMNDVVVRVKSTLKEESGYVTEAVFGIDVLALGADKRIGAAIQFDKLTPAQVERTKRFSSYQHVISQFSVISADKLLERGQTHAVLPLFDDVNTLVGGNFVNVGDFNGLGIEIEYPYTDQITVYFPKNTVRKEDLSYKNINFFILPGMKYAIDKQRRLEIHLGGYSGTDLANEDLWGKGVDNGTGKFISIDRMVWGLLIPSDRWQCPEENVSILAAYPDFKKWVLSGGKENQNWYLNKKN